MAVPVEPPPGVTCYSGGESDFMRRWQTLRGRLLAPILAVLARVRVTPNHLTLLSLLVGLAFCPVFLWASRPAAFTLLLTHLLLDGLDGPLARFTRRASNRGSFSDTMADQVVVTFSTVTLIHTGHAGAWPGGLYVFFYCMVVIFAMVRNALDIPYTWLIRPRLLVYAWIPVEVYLWRESLDPILWILSVLLAVKMLTGFIQIRKRI